VSELQSLLRPYLLRRTKEEVAEKLPRKSETLLKVELTVEQKRVYRAVLDRNLGAIANPRSSLNNAFMQLRKARHLSLSSYIYTCICIYINLHIHIHI